MIVLAMQLPLSVAGFGPSEQQSFTTALARTAAVNDSRVIIRGVSKSTRRASTTQLAAIEVLVNIATKSKEEAARVLTSLTESALSEEMKKVGLPPGRFTVRPRLASETNSPLTWQFMALVVGSVSFLAAVIAAVSCVFCRSQRRHLDEDEMRLLAMVERLRVRLQLTRTQGFILNTEHLTLLERCCGTSPAVIRKQWLEAVARMCLRWVYEPSHIDLLWLFLLDRARCGSASSSVASDEEESPHGRRAREAKEAQNGVPFQQLRRLILETCILLK